MDSAINSLYNLECECADPFINGDTAYIFSSEDAAIVENGLSWNEHLSKTLDLAPYNETYSNRYFLSNIYFYSVYINRNMNINHAEIYSVNTIPFSKVNNDYIDEINDILDNHVSDTIRSSIVMHIGRQGVIRWRVYDAEKKNYISYFIDANNTNLLAKIDEAEYADVEYSSTYGQSHNADFNKTQFWDSFTSDNFCLTPNRKKIYFGHNGSNSDISPMIDCETNELLYWVHHNDLTRYGYNYYAYGFTLFAIFDDETMLAYHVPQVMYSDPRYLRILVKGTEYWNILFTSTIFSGGWANTYGDYLNYVYRLSSTTFLARISFTTVENPDRSYGCTSIGKIDKENKTITWTNLDSLFEEGYELSNRPDAICINGNGYVNGQVSTIATVIVKEGNTYSIRIINLSTAGLVNNFDVTKTEEGGVESSLYYMLSSNYYMNFVYITSSVFKRVAYLAHNQIHGTYPLGFAANNYQVGDIGTFLICFE